MVRALLIAIILASAVGCGTPKLEDSKAQAQQRWYHTRAQLLCGVAIEQLKNGQLEIAASKAQEAMSLEPDCVEARILLGKIYIEQGEYKAAISELTKACDQQAKSPEPLYLLAVAQERNGDLQLALETYRKSQALDSRNLESVKAAVEVLIQLGRHEEARLYLDGYLGASGSDPGVYELAGRLAMMARSYDKAVRHYQRAHDLDSQNIRYRESLAQAQLLHGDYIEAAQTLSDLLALKDYVASPTLYCSLGDCQLAMKKPLEARDSFFKASQIDPQVAGIWIGLSKSALMAGDMTRARLSARKALELEANNTDAIVLLGYVLLKEGQKEKALSLLADAARANPENGVLQCVLGRAYAANGKATQALDCYQEALRIDPGNTLAKELACDASASNTRDQ